MTRRVYLAVGEAGLRQLADHGRVAGSRAFAVTQVARAAAQPGEDEETLEYDAFLYASGAFSGRPVVVSAEVDERYVRDLAEPEGYAVAVTEPVELAWVVSIHVAELDAGADDELLWFDVSELHDLVADAGGSAELRPG